MTSRVKEYLGRGLLAILYGSSLTVVFACIAGISVPALTAYAWAAGAGCLFALGGIQRKTLFFTLPACVAAIVLFRLPQGCAALEPAALTAAAAMFFAFIACLFSGQRSGAFLLAVIFGLSVIFSRRSETPVSLLNLVPGALALLMQCAYTAGKKGAQWNAFLPAALIAAVLAFALTPAEGTVYPPLHDFAERVRDKITELTDVLGQYGGFNDDRIAYSVCMDGYQPMVNMLGGPATPNPEAVMDVTTDTALHLRGSIRRYYNGHSWIDDSVNSRYVFLDPAKKHTRDEIFDANREAGDPVSADIVFLKGSESSALFVPHRLKSLDLDALTMVAYYNSAGEVFLTRPVEEGDAYSVSASEVNIGTELVEQPDSKYEEIRTEFTRLPDGIDAGVYDLAASLSAGGALETARNIESWLAQNCRYETNVDYPPLDRDFVSYFLTETREGYCTYFASAFSVLCRMTGIPTRYIEGYLAVPDETGTAHVTGENAHAWVEIYLSGIGWVTADPTAAAQNASGGEPDRGETGPDSAPEPPDEPEDPNEDPEDEPEDEPEGSPEEPEEEPESPESEPEDEPENEPDAEPETEPEEDADADRSAALLLLLVLLALAAAAAFTVIRMRKTDPKRMITRKDSELDRLTVIYRALLTALEYRGIRPQPGETAEAFADRAVRENGADSRVSDFVHALTEAVYSGREPSFRAKNALGAYAAVVSGMKLREKLRWTAGRIAKGIGNTERIP